MVSSTKSHWSYLSGRIIQSTGDRSNKSSPKGMTRELYFPTIIYRNTIENADVLNQVLLTHVYREHDDGNGGIQPYDDQLHRQRAYSGLCQHIGSAMRHIEHDLGYDNSYKLQLSGMWSLINSRGTANPAGIHPGCVWNGIYYVRAPEGSGDIEFTDPRTCNLMTQPKFTPDRKRPRNSWTKVRFTPSAGKLLVFPGWLYHSVHPNLSTEIGRSGDSVSIGFKISQVKDC